MIVAVSQPPIPPTAPNDGFRDFLPAPPADSSSLTCPHGPLPHQRPAVTRRILGVWHFRHFRLWMRREPRYRHARLLRLWLP